jgi:GAF domain-containing protein
LVLREATGEAGRILKERGHRLRVSMDSMVGYAALRQETRAAMNVSEDTVRFANPLLPDAQSEAALPLIVGGEVIGALDVQSVMLNAFDESTLIALQTMASQVAVALQNAQSFQGLQKTLDYTTRQYELSRAIFQAQTPGEAYLSLGQVFAMFSDVDRIQLLRVVERDANHQPAVYEPAIEWDILGGAQMNTGQSSAAAETPLAALVSKDEATVIRDATDTRLPVATRERLAQVNAQAIILVPLIIGTEYSGFVAAVSEQPREFTENEVRLMKSAAEQLGVVLTNLQLSAEMQTTIERVALLNRRLSGEAWDSYRGGRALQRVESGRLDFITPENQLQVPIVVRGETIGAFNVADNNLERSWHEDELSLLQIIAGEVALAIDNARLIEQSQRTAQREKDVAVAADQIHRSINLETILNTALSEITRITGVADVAIQFGSPTGLPGNGQHVLAP